MKLVDFTHDALKRLDKIFPQYLTGAQQSVPILQQAMEYTVLLGGKRIRPILIYLTGRALGADWEELDAPACAIEFIHVYSLIHDDLPAMDNADLRRGKPACHKAFNEAIAILAGDALQPLAFEIITTHPSKLSSAQRLSMIQVLCQASGGQGMAAGQALDLAGVSSIEALTEMYSLKTGALLTACVKLGAIAANKQHEEAYPALEKFAQNIGLAFQIQDDLLDIEGTPESIGKPKGLDTANHKITYPTLIGVEESRKKIRELFDSAFTAIDFMGENASLLKEFTQTLLQRKK